MKKTLSLILAVVTVLLVITMFPSVGAETLRSGDYKYKVLDDGTVKLVKYIGNGLDMTIPSKIDGKKVTAIGANYADKDPLLEGKFVIPDTITSIHESAFNGEVDTLVFGKNLKSSKFVLNLIVYKNFVSKSKHIKVDNGILYNSDRSKLLRCPREKKLKGYKLPNSVMSIEQGAFRYCKNAVSIKLNNVKRIKDYAFMSSSISSIYVTSKVEQIGKWAFEDCKNLKSVKFSDNKNLQIMLGAFANTGITSVDVAYDVQDFTFRGCNKLKKVSIGKNVKKIGKEAFYNCSFKTVTISSSIKKIGKHSLGYYGYYADYCKIKGFTIKGVKGSAAEKYAKNNGFTFKVVKE